MHCTPLTLCGVARSQIITNGVSNAAKLTKQGKVELVAQTRDQKLWFEVRPRVSGSIGGRS